MKSEHRLNINCNNYIILGIIVTNCNCDDKKYAGEDNMILNTVILLDGLVFPESLRWHDDKLWFSDVYDQKVMTVDIAGHSETVVRLPGLPSGLGWLPNNQFVIVSVIDQALLQLDQGRLVNIADLRNLESGSLMS